MYTNKILCSIYIERLGSIFWWNCMYAMRCVYIIEYQTYLRIQTFAIKIIITKLVFTYWSLIAHRHSLCPLLIHSVFLHLIYIYRHVQFDSANKWIADDACTKCYVFFYFVAIFLITFLIKDARWQCTWRIQKNVLSYFDLGSCF